jgi:hypothetical protein
MDQPGKRSMMRCRALLAMTFLGLPCTQGAHVFFDPPWITPQAPVAGQPVAVNIHHGGMCDAIAERPGFPQITREGNAIRILEYGHHWDFQDFCIYVPATVTHQFGAFPPGDYTLTVDFTYSDFLPAPVVVTLGVIPFTVAGQQAPASPVPATTAFGACVLFAFIVVLARRTTRARSRECSRRVTSPSA